jgi:hypothetical protein
MLQCNIIGNSYTLQVSIPVPSINFAAKETYLLHKQTSLTKLLAKYINGWLKGGSTPNSV